MNLTAGSLEQAFDMELPLLCVMHSKGGFAFECRWAIESFQSFVVVVGVVDLLGHVGVDYFDTIFVVDIEPSESVATLITTCPAVGRAMRMPCRL